jgi:hypothetical protein
VGAKVEEIEYLEMLLEDKNRIIEIMNQRIHEKQ